MTAPDRVTDALRQDILSGLLLPGERLVELDLAGRYDCGRAGVRSALVALEGEGLVDRRANKGAVVRRVGLAEVIQITEARAVLEVLVARHAARYAGDDERSGLKSVIDDMRAAVAGEDYSGYFNLSRELHLRLRGASRHVVASGLIANLANRAAHHRYREMMPGRPDESLSEHEIIVDAVVSGDEDAAAAAMEGHMASLLHVLRHWDDTQVSD